MSGVEYIVKFDHFDRFIAGFEPAIGEENFALAEACTELSAAHAPVLSGELRDSHETTRVSENEAESRADAGHAVYVEYGTRYMAAQPFMTPAAEQTALDRGARFARRIEALI